jgi:hypothetical protein
MKRKFSRSKNKSRKFFESFKNKKLEALDEMKYLFNFQRIQANEISVRIAKIELILIKIRFTAESSQKHGKF